MLAAYSSLSRPDLESRVAFLRQPSSYPQPVFRVEAIETHMSWVFLTEGHAWKLKKPVRHDLLDFTTVESRHFFCGEEVRLNRRLAPDIYLGVVPLSLDARGHFHLGKTEADVECGGSGATIDWLVKMRRIPMDSMLDHALIHRSLRAEDVRRIASRLAKFYSECPAVEMDAATYRAGFLHNIDRNLAELCRPAHGLPDPWINRLCHAQRRLLEERPALVEDRARAGRIVEGHGDLRPEHVCFSPGVAVIDCLEFARDLRLVDPMDEIAFLALECERLDAPDDGALLLRTCQEISGDWPDPALVHFYQSYRASLRARIAIAHLDEAKFRHSSLWRRRAINYLRLAQRHQCAANSVIDPPS